MNKQSFVLVIVNMNCEMHVNTVFFVSPVSNQAFIKCQLFAF